MAQAHGHGHGHGPSRDSDRRWLVAALVVLLVFMAGEVVVGIVARSLALLTDAGHLLSDAAALGLAVVALQLAARPATGAYTYGLKRAEILSAQANGITLAVLVVVFTYEAVRRLLAPPDVAGGLVTVTAAVGIVVNLLATWLVRRADRRSLNVEGAYLHLLTDLLAFVATVLREHRAGRDCRASAGGWRTDLLRAAQWRASRYGVSDTLVDPHRRSLAPALTVAHALVEHIADALDEAGQRSTLLDLVDQLVDAGGGAARQRRVHERTGRLDAVVADLAERTARS